ncbi:MAG: hypothetical protein GYA43_02555, partial [Bacteroidales bacterium]|nr:hypothetical protein [Bacteroidales bacterium]
MKRFLVFAILSACIFISCSRGKKPGPSVTGLPEQLQPDNGFKAFITSFTSGVIPSRSAIEVHFTREFSDSADHSKLSGLFTFDPPIKGEAEWTDELTLVFRPSKPLPSGTLFRGTLNLRKIASVEQRLAQFPLSFRTIEKDFTINPGELQLSAEINMYDFTGEIVVSDYADPSETESWVSVKIDDKPVALTWEHNETENTHRFTAGKIERLSKERVLVVSWDGRRSGINQKASSEFRIPSLNSFVVQNAELFAGETNRIELTLSDPPDETQDIEGLIWFSPPLEAVIRSASNKISIYPVITGEVTATLNVEPSLKNKRGIALGTAWSETFSMSSEVLKPGLKAAGKGVIMPSSGELIFPFMAAGLKAADLTIVKIYENNLPYFLQTSDLDERGPVKRFGKPVFRGKIDLSSPAGRKSGGWTLYTIDLGRYIKTEPGVLYRVTIGMRRSYSLFNCSEEPAPSKYEEMLDRYWSEWESSWNDTESYYDSPESSIFYDYAYNWRERENPCSDSYYEPGRNLIRNILASNLGITAKAGEDRYITVTVTDLRDALPVSGASVTIYNYQMQTAGTGTTAQDGSAVIPLTDKPFLVIVTKGSDRNYLKTTDGLALPLSTFDISGVKPEKGIKAFVYGERDVWRPGDSIYLSVIVRDLKKELPEGHPVRFELINPLGQKTDNQVQNLPASGLLVFRTITDNNAVTGNYNAVITIGGASFSKRVRVETIKPNRLKIGLSFSREILGEPEKTDYGKITASWLNGVTAKNLKTDVELLLRRSATTFSGYPGYTFDDVTSGFSSTTVKIYEGITDENGLASFNFSPVPATAAPGMLNALFTVKVYEKGGDASIIQKSYRYSPFSAYAGISFPGLSGKNRILYTDRDNEIRIVAVNSEGKPLSATADVNIYKSVYRWWWESDINDQGYYNSSSNFTVVMNRKVNLKEGSGSVTFNVPKSEWGKYLVKVSLSSGHTAGAFVMVDWPWEYGLKGAEGASLLTVNTDREKYAPGDKIELNFPAPVNSKAYITLENSTGILYRTVADVSGVNSVVTMVATPEMAPNVYACVSVIQPHGQTLNDMPIRLYGVVPVLVEDPGTRITPVITCPAEVRSAKPFEIKVNESSGKPMSYTLAVVDEGLLDLTGFTTPDPWNYFYAREALGVKTWDLYDYVIGAMGGALSRTLAPGGDEALKDKAKAREKRFEPVVVFAGPFDLAAGKTNTHKINLPVYTGSVKAYVIAGRDKRFGAASEQIFVRDPLMILATAPRVLGPGEKISLPVTVFVQKENIKNVTLSAEGNENIKFETGTLTVPFSEPGEKDAVFAFTTGEKTGRAIINIKAEGGGETATFRLSLDIRSPNPPETRSEITILSAGQAFNKSFTLFGMQGTSSAQLELSLLPSVNLGKRLGYLVDYPHGCSEQVVSAAFPQIWIRDLVPGGGDLTAKASSNVSSALGTLLRRQMAGGGIALWPGSYQPDNWATSYAGHFMLEAERRGFSVPSSLKQKWLGYQKTTAQKWTWDPKFRYSSIDQAYRLFTLALAGQPDRGAMNRLRETQGLPQLAGWLLAASYALTGKTEVAGMLTDVRNIKPEPEYSDYYFGSSLRDRALILYILAMLDKNEEALPLLKEVCEELNRDYWYSTQTTAWALLAYMKYAEKFPGAGKNPAKVNVALNGKRWDELIVPGTVTTKSLAINERGNNNLSVENISEVPLYVTLVLRGIPFRSEEVKTEKGISMQVEYFNTAMKNINEQAIEQGTDFMMVVRVT